MAGIKCCHGCVPPKRHIGCHATCKNYIDEKAQFEKDKKKIKANNREAWKDAIAAQKYSG